METEAKYYTPSFEEFCLGQTLYTKDLQHIIKLDTIDELIHFFLSQNMYVNSAGETYGLSPENYKIKYLDAEDIESFGFKLIFSDIGIEYWKLGNFELRTDVDLGAYIDSDNLYSIFYNPYGKQYNCVFSGIIKNKSKLKQVLKMIGVH